VGEISLPIVEALPTTEPPKRHLIAIHFVGAEHGGLIKKKESSWVKLKMDQVDIRVRGCTFWHVILRSKWEFQHLVLLHTL